MNSSSPIEEVNRGLPPWLASTLLRRRDLAPRFVYWRQRLARQSRGWRRRLRRQLAVGGTSAAPVSYTHLDVYKRQSFVIASSY